VGGLSEALSPPLHLRALAASAVIGSGRSGGGTVTPQQLLTQAAASGLRARAGRKAGVFSGGIVLCPPESQPVAGGPMMATLLRLMGDPDAALIDEWAGLAKAKGVRVAEATVPAVLDWWSRQPHRSDVVFEVLGVRAGWLASLNPAWRKPVAGGEIPANGDDVWQTGTPPERTALLTTVRSQDPRRALALVQATWKNDGADERRRFVEVLRVGLSMDDEPFLEAALDDKSKLVRRAAAESLGPLNGSRFKARMNERARAMIGVTRKGAATRITLTPPSEIDPSWERDDVDPMAKTAGKRAYWLKTVLGAADLSVLTDVSGLDAAGVIKALRDDDYFDDALAAIIQAVQVSKEPAWISAVATASLGRIKKDTGVFFQLFGILAGPESEAFALDVLGNDRFAPEERWALLGTLEHAWSESFSVAALKMLLEQKASKNVHMLYNLVSQVANVVAPAAASFFEETVRAMFTDEPTDSFKKSIDRVRLRADMHKEFAS